jgi:hypothetical protein
MANSAKLAPPYSVILIEDSGGGEIPSSIKMTTGSLIASTDSCIAVGCRSYVDGDTEFTLGQTHDVDPGDHPILEAIFQGKLKTPNLKIVLRSVAGRTILEASVPQQETVVRVWVNDQPSRTE